MSVETAVAVVGALAAYFAVGLVFALAFVTWGIVVIDPAARGMPSLARLLIVPGAAALWPLLLWKWFARQSPPLS